MIPAHRLLTLRGWAAVLFGVVLIAVGMANGAIEAIAFGIALLILTVLALLVLRFSPAPEIVGSHLTDVVVLSGDELTLSLTLSRPRSAVGIGLAGWSIERTEGFDVLVPPRPTRWTPVSRTHVITHVDVPIRTTERGRHSLGQLRIERIDPLGLAGMTSRREIPGELRVGPALIDLGPAPAAIGIGAPRRRSHGGQETDTGSPRGYVPGDPIRRIHWPATARLGDLMVRQDEPLQTASITVMLDLGQVWPAEWVERAVSVVASTAWRWHREGIGVSVASDTGAVLCTLPAGGPDAVARRSLADALSVVSPPPASRRHDGGAVFVVTPHWTAATSDRLGLVGSQVLVCAGDATIPGCHFPLPAFEKAWADHDA